MGGGVCVGDWGRHESASTVTRRGTARLGLDSDAAWLFLDGDATRLALDSTEYIGSHTVLQLLQQGFRVVVIDNLDKASHLAIV
jgi:hypothetical protein